MFATDLELVFKLWLLTLSFGLISLPLSTRLFPKLSDKGYFLGKLLCLFVVAFALFTLATLKVLPLGFPSLVFLLTIWSLANLFLWWKKRDTSPNWKLIFFEEAIFLLLFSVFVWIKGHQPEIYQIERFMDYGFIKSLTQSQFLPVEDIWRAGQPLNYYYFGHFLAYVLITLTKLPTVAGFFLVQCWLFAFAGILGFVVGSSLVKNWHFSTKWAAFAGLLSLFAVVFAGDWQSFNWYANKILFEVFHYGSIPNFWYPDPTRIIPGTISEIPIYSFIVADLHAHVWGFLLGAALICTLTSFWFQKDQFLKTSLVIAFLLGLSIMTNTWDFLTLGSIVFLVVIFKLKDLTLTSLIGYLFICFVPAVLFALPWLFFFKSPLGGIGVVTKWSPPVAWFLFWGPTVFLIFLYFLSKLRHKLNFDQEGLIAILFALSVVWLVFLEVFYAKDILSSGEWFRANTYFKVSLQILLWVGLMTGPTIFIIVSKTRDVSKLIISAILSFWILTRVVYPIKAVNQANIEGRKYTGLSSGLDFWNSHFPEDFQAFKFLETKQKGVVLEADGDSYQDTSFFSTFLGWPTITGWAVHEWTWHGVYDEVGKRAGEVREVYTGKDLQKTKDILKNYNVKYIIIGSAEKRKYPNMNFAKLKSLGKVIYQPNLSSTYIIGL